MPKGVYNRSKRGPYKKTITQAKLASGTVHLTGDNVDVAGITQHLTIPTVQTETDDQIKARLTDRFEVMESMVSSVIKGKSNALIISGPAGLGKSYTVEQKLASYDPNEEKSIFCKGFSRATGLYKTLYNYREKGQVAVFDDCDAVFFDPICLNLFKAALDTCDNRRLFWGAETRMVDDSGELLPNMFSYYGSIIFITNYDFDLAIARNHRLSTDFGALLSRSHYIDMGIKTIRDYIVRMNQVVHDEKMLEDRGFKTDEANAIMRYIENNQTRLRELTLRMVIKVSDLYRSYPAKWEKMADITCLKNT